MSRKWNRRGASSEKVDENASTTEQRLTLIEGCLDGMQTQSDGFTDRMENIEQLLQRLVGAPECRAAQFHRPSWKTRVGYMGRMPVLGITPIISTIILSSPVLSCC